MPKRDYFASVTLDVAASTQRSPVAVAPGEPFRILILSDFSGRANRKIHTPVAGRRPMLVDRDNLDQVLARMAAELRRPVSLRFRELEDFHPDRIYEHCESFRDLREATPSSPSHRSNPPEPAPASAPADLAAAGLLDRLVDESEAENGAAAVRQPDRFEDYLRAIVAPHSVPGDDPAHAKWRAALQTAAGQRMRAILHHPDFQALESAWRSVDLLVRRLQTNADLKVYLFDITKAELQDDLAAVDDPRSSGLFHLLAQGVDRWGVIVGNYVFQQSTPDAELLKRLSGLASAAGAPFLAESAPPEPDPPEDWSALRHSPDAQWVGLALPRFLLRLPYGPDTATTESFPFEEMPGRSEHTSYLWANPAFACAYLLAEAFSCYGWELRPGVCSRVDGLPVHVYSNGEETEVKPCAEVLLTEDAAEDLLECGVMPLASIKNTGSVQLVRFQSIADPPAPLAGRWN